MGKFKKVLREFVVTTKSSETEIFYYYKAIVQVSYFSCYRIIVNATKFVNHEIVSRNVTELYFKDKEEMIKEFEYQYKINKENLFIKSITILK